jgi:hypothetical protein
MKFLSAFTLLVLWVSSHANPALEMNKAFNALTELIPYFKNEEAFKEKNNEKIISENLKSLSDSFKSAGHDVLIKQDLFAPSYKLIMENVHDSHQDFLRNKKDYSLRLLRETISSCLDCHSRLPESVTSSFQNGELSINQKNLKTPYDLGVTFMIIRRYVDAKEQFLRSFQDAVIKKDSAAMMGPIKHIMSVELKIKKNPQALEVLLHDLTKKRNLPIEIQNELLSFMKRLETWKKESALTSPLKNDKDIQAFISRKLTPLKKKNSFNDAFKVDLLLASGVLSNYFFDNPETPMAAELSLWLGWIEKRLKKEDFISSGDLFLKQCIRKYPRSRTAKECLQEYKESVEFDFTGSSGTSLPAEIEKELKELQKLIRTK